VAGAVGWWTSTGVSAEGLFYLDSPYFDSDYGKAFFSRDQFTIME
jgi:hypothetical protein